jgi:hypothetical protein
MTAKTAIAAMVSGLVGTSEVPPPESTSSFIVEVAPGETLIGMSSEIFDGIEATETFDTFIDGFSAELTTREVEVLQQSPKVLVVYPDVETTVDATQGGDPWDLSRLD